MTEQKRKRPKFKGPIKSRQHKRSKERRGNVDKSKMNDGNFYEGMPGCTIEKYKEKGEDKIMRKFITFVVTEDGESKALIYAHPQLSAVALQQAIESNTMIRQIVYGATVNTIFKKKTIWNWILRMSYKRWFKRQHKKIRQPLPKELTEKKAEMKIVK